MMMTHRPDLMIMTALRRTALATGFMVLLGAPLTAQASTASGLLPGEDPDIVDRVAAVVGDSIILLSQVQEELVLQTGGQLPSSPDQLREAMMQILDGLITTQVILQEAGRDSTMMIPEERLDALVDQRVDQARSTVGGEEAFQAALIQDGVTEEEFRGLIRDRAREGELQQLYISRTLGSGRPVAVTEAEMREVFERERGQLEQLPERITLQQILIKPEASTEAWAAARLVADSIYAQVSTGADFAEMAMARSTGPSAPEGGDLGWARRGNFVREYEEVAFSLAPGAIAPPVRSDFGWHVIKVDRVRPGEVKSRHILIAPESSPSDSERAQQLADSLAEAIRGGADPRPIYQEHGEPMVQQEGTALEFEVEPTRQDLNTVFPPGYTLALIDTPEGGVATPFRTSIQTPQGPQEFWVVVRVKEIRGAGEFTFEDYREQIRAQIEQNKRLERLITSLRDAAYIDIRL